MRIKTKLRYSLNMLKTTVEKTENETFFTDKLLSSSPNCMSSSCLPSCVEPPKALSESGKKNPAEVQCCCNEQFHKLIHCNYCTLIYRYHDINCTYHGKVLAILASKIIEYLSKASRGVHWITVYK